MARTVPTPCQCISLHEPTLLVTPSSLSPLEAGNGRYSTQPLCSPSSVLRSSSCLVPQTDSRRSHQQVLDTISSDRPQIRISGGRHPITDVLHRGHILWELISTWALMWPIEHETDLWKALEQGLWIRLLIANAPVAADCIGRQIQASAIHFSFWLSQDIPNGWYHG